MGLFGGSISGGSPPPPPPPPSKPKQPSLFDIIAQSQNEVAEAQKKVDQLEYEAQLVASLGGGPVDNIEAQAAYDFQQVIDPHPVEESSSGGLFWDLWNALMDSGGSIANGFDPDWEKDRVSQNENFQHQADTIVDTGIDYAKDKLEDILPDLPNWWQRFLDWLKRNAWWIALVAGGLLFFLYKGVGWAVAGGKKVAPYVPYVIV